MNEKRALEIVNSKEMVGVTYNGRPVYIEEVITTKDTASIHYLNQPEYSQVVHLTHLMEAK